MTSKSSRVVKFSFIVGIIVVVFLVFLIRDTYEKLNATKLEYDKTNQQLESISAQLQVVYEHKSRLENSLEQEKSQHKKSKEELTNELEEQKLEASGKYATLQQQYQMLKSQHEDLESEFDNLSSSHQKLSSQCSTKDGTISKLREEIGQLDNANGKLSYELEKCKENNSFRPAFHPHLNQNQGRMPSSSTSSAKLSPADASSKKQKANSPQNLNVIHKPNSVSEKIKSMDSPPQDVNFIEAPSFNYDSHPDVDPNLENKGELHVLPAPST